MSTVNAAINLAGDGTVAYRSEHAGDVTVTRTGAGVYEIHGAAGMPANGWRTSVPRGDSVVLKFGQAGELWRRAPSAGARRRHVVGAARRWIATLCTTSSSSTTHR